MLVFCVYIVLILNISLWCMAWQHLCWIMYRYACICKNWIVIIRPLLLSAKHETDFALKLNSAPGKKLTLCHAVLLFSTLQNSFYNILYTNLYVHTIFLCCVFQFHISFLFFEQILPTSSYFLSPILESIWIGDIYFICHSLVLLCKAAFQFKDFFNISHKQFCLVQFFLSDWYPI